MLLLNLILLVSVCGLAYGSSYEEETTITDRERAAIAKLKARMLPKIPSTSRVNDYINDNLYVVRWLRAKSGVVNAAEQLFTDHLKWREKERMDTIHEEDFSEIDKDFPVFFDGYGRAGQPVAEFWLAEWPLRTAVISGKLKQVMRATTRLFEMESRRLYGARARGEKVAQAMFLCDLNGFTVLQQACPGCLPYYVTLSGCLENQYPGILEHLLFINTPPSFDIIFRLIKPILRQATRKGLKLYGSSRSEWMPIIKAIVEPDQVSIRFGGTIDRHVHKQ